MKLDGHTRITNSAIRSFKRKCTKATQIFICRDVQFNTMNIKWHNSSNSNSKDNSKLLYLLAAQELSLLSDTASTSLINGYLTRKVSAVDIEPWKLRYHVTNDGQKYHFMRISEEQTNKAAYTDAVNLIKLQSQKWLNKMRQVYYSNYKFGRGSTNRKHQLNHIRQKAASELAIALHALQDSFSPAHTRREHYSTPRKPGAISEIYVYADQDHDKHSVNDFNSGSAKSALAQSAVYASADLMNLCAKSLSMKSKLLFGWGQFQNRWLKFED